MRHAATVATILQIYHGQLPNSGTCTFPPLHVFNQTSEYLTKGITELAYI